MSSSADTIGAPGEIRTPDLLVRSLFRGRCNQMTYTDFVILNRLASFALFPPSRCVSQSLVKVFCPQKRYYSE